MIKTTGEASWKQLTAALDKMDKKTGELNWNFEKVVKNMHFDMAT